MVTSPRSSLRFGTSVARDRGGPGGLRGGTKVMSAAADIPDVSVLLPAFDAATTLRRALASVRRQTGVTWECVVVDDGSTDETPALVSALTTQDPRFRLVRCGHGGIVPALGAGLERCRGALTARMDADDVMLPGRLVSQVEALTRDPTLVAVATHVRLFPRRGLRAGRLAYERWLNSLTTADEVLLDAFVECPAAHPTLTIRTAALRRFGYRAVGWAEDYDLVLRLLAAGERVGVVPRVLHRWRDSPGRLSRRDPVYGQAQFVACKAAFLASGLLSARPEYVLWGHGDTGRALRRALLAHGKRPRYIVELHPRRLGQRIGGASVVPPTVLGLHRDLPVVVSVAGAVARGQIRAFLSAMGYVDGRDYRVAA